MVWIWNGIWNPGAQPFEIQTNSCHFVKNHLKSGRKKQDFKCFRISNGRISDPHCFLSFDVNEQLMIKVQKLCKIKERARPYVQQNLVWLDQNNDLITVCAIFQPSLYQICKKQVGKIEFKKEKEIKKVAKKSIQDQLAKQQIKLSRGEICVANFIPLQMVWLSNYFVLKSGTWIFIAVKSASSLLALHASAVGSKKLGVTFNIELLSCRAVRNLLFLSWK